MNAETAIPAVAGHDLYYAVHKGLRLANARMLIALGRADAADEAGLISTLGALAAHLDLCQSHLEHENDKIHARIEARLPGGADHAEDDHDHHLEAFADLRRLAEDVAMAGADRAGQLRRLYQRFALFMADDLTHMHEEETRLMPCIWTHFSHDEVMGIEQDIVTSIPPGEMTAFTRAILAAASRTERVGMVSGMQAGMPAEVFDPMMTAVAGAAWQPGDWDGLDRALS